MALNDILLQQREAAEAPHRSWTTLYHGTTEKIYETIMQDGFRLTQGRRAVGGMGATIIVNNQGIFLADSANLASFFGGNRSDNNQHKVIKTQVDTSRIMDSSAADVKLRKLGLDLLSAYNGLSKTKLAIRDWWWLVDQSAFVEVIKQGGHTGVRFKEDTSVRRQANAFDGHTYCVFDLATIRIPEISGVSMQDFYHWLKANSK